MDFFRQLIDGITSAWGKLNASARVNIGLAAAAVIGLVIVLVWWGGRPNFVVLWSNLTGEDVTSIVSELKDRRVPYQIANGGTTIRVPSSQVNELRIELAGRNLPSAGGVGFEIFDRPNLGVTEFVQRVNYERALNTELARTISKIDNVRSARVRVTLPEEALFAEERKEPTASVLVSLTRPGALSPAQVNAILHLVATSVEGLKESNIAIVDSQGNVLAAPTDDKDWVGALTNKQLAALRDFEKYKEDKAKEALGKVLKQRKYLVAVGATLDFDEVKEEKLEYNEGILRSEETSSETSTSSQKLPRGVPGVTAGLPAPGETSTTPSTSTDKTSEQTTTTFELPETYTSTKKAPGTVKKLLVAALIEGRYQTSEGSTEKTYVPLEPAEIERYRQIIAGAVGLDETRGDTITVTDAPFEEAAIEMEAPGPPWYSQLPIAQIVLGAAALIAFIVLRRVLSQAAVGPRTPVEQLAPPEVYEVPEEVAAREKVRDQITRLSREQPDVVASVLKTWLAEEE
jgi:flagellar M-ring protein FliF